MGVMTVEFFVTRTQTLVLNEIAPRVHNSGHWTIEGAYTSQFENHVRAITDLPLGCTEALMPVAMINCVGVKPDMRAVLAIPGSHYHWYGKPSVEPDRKVGHITLLATSEAILETRIALMLELLRRT
jgi:5-(carboxyamino)imidazole ribonucleotide synthase